MRCNAARIATRAACSALPCSAASRVFWCRQLTLAPPRGALAEAGLAAESNAARLGPAGAAPRGSSERLRADLAADRARHERAAAAAAREAAEAAAELAAAELARAKVRSAELGRRKAALRSLCALYPLRCCVSRLLFRTQAEAADAAEEVARASDAARAAQRGAGAAPSGGGALASFFGARAPEPPPQQQRRRRKAPRAPGPPRARPVRPSGDEAAAPASLRVGVALPLAWSRATLLRPAGAPEWRAGGAAAGSDAAAVLAPNAAALRGARLLGLLPPPHGPRGSAPAALPPRPGWIDGDLRAAGGDARRGGRRLEKAGAWLLVRLSLCWQLSPRADGGVALTPCAASASVSCPGLGGARVAAGDADASQRRTRHPPAAPLVPLLAPARMALLVALAGLRALFPARAAAPSRRARLLEFAREAEAAALSPRRASALQTAWRASDGGSGAMSPGSGPASPRNGGRAFSPRDQRSGSGAAGAAADASAAYERAAAKAAAAAEALAAARAASRTLSPRGSAAASGAASGVASPASVASPRSNIAFWRRRDSSTAAGGAAAGVATSEAPAWRAAAAAAAAARAARGGGPAPAPAEAAALSPRGGKSPALALSPEASYDAALAAEAHSAAFRAATQGRVPPPQPARNGDKAPPAEPKSKARAASSQPLAAPRPPPLVAPPGAASATPLSPARLRPASPASAPAPVASPTAASPALEGNYNAKDMAAFWRQTTRDAPPVLPPSPTPQPGARFSGTVAAAVAAAQPAARRSAGAPAPAAPPPAASGDAKTALLAELYSAELQMEQISYEIANASAPAPPKGGKAAGKAGRK